MTHPTLIAIAVVARNHVIGNGHGQPFTFREDWARFKRVTMGHPLICGRKTYDAMGVLTGRTMIVITRSPVRLEPPQMPDDDTSFYVVGSLDEAIAVAGTVDDTVYVIGGGEIYRAAWDRLDVLDVTEVHADAEGHVTFPVIDPHEWREVSRIPRDEFDFVTYHRRLGDLDEALESTVASP